MNWPKELEELLVNDMRFVRDKSKFADNVAFYLEGKEIAHFQPEGFDVRVGAAGIYALQSKLVEESVLTVTKDWVLLRIASEEDMKFALAILDRAVREAYNPNPGPKGKQTRRAASTQKSEALRGFANARALRELEEFVPAKPKAKAKPVEKAKSEAKAKPKKKSKGKKK